MYECKAYGNIWNRISEKETAWQDKAIVIHYLAVAPSLFPVIAENIAKNKLSDRTRAMRIVIEKPFGHDLESAKELNQLLKKLQGRTDIPN